MARATITGVWMDNGTYIVKYATGTEKTYSADKLPKTVQAWIEAENSKPEPELVQEFVKETFPELFQPVTEWIKPEQPEQPEQPETVKASDEAEQKEIRMEVQEMKKAEIITTATTVARSPKASEAVMFGVCMTLAVIWHILKESVILLAIATATAACILWNNRQEITACIRKASAGMVTTVKASAEIIRAESVKVVEVIATATDTGKKVIIANLPKLEVIKDKTIIHSYESIRAMIITVSILAFTARITAR